METVLAEQLEPLHADAFGWALHCCGGDRTLAEDVLQNAYVKAVSGRASHGGRSSVKTWWFGVVRLTALEEMRRARLRNSTAGRLWNWINGQPPEPPASPARLAEAGEENARLRSALAVLPARQSEVLHLVFYQDLSLSEAAAVMKVGLGSARQHYERGKARLRQLLNNPDSPAP